jgi:hypothetical protein
MSKSALKIDHMQRRVWLSSLEFLMIDCSCKIDYKMILIGNYTCSQNINEKSHFLFGKHACDFSLVLLEPCNFLYYIRLDGYHTNGRA